MWNGKANSELADTKLSIRKAAEIARVMASHNPTTDPVELLKNSLEKAKTESELAKHYQENTPDKMTGDK